MKSQKMKQWIKDYLDFAMPLIMVIVALNLVDLFMIRLPFEYNIENYRPKLSDLFNGYAHLNSFIKAANADRLLIYSLIFLGLALFVRLFSNRLLESIDYPFRIIALVYIIYYGFVNINGKSYMWSFAFMAVNLFVIYIAFPFAFKMLKIFFTNFPKIKSIVYISMTILYLFTLMVYLLKIPNTFLVAKWILLIAILSLATVSILYYVVFSILSFFNMNVVIIKPRDIIEWEIDIKLEAESTIEAYKEQQRRQNIINDIADAVRKRL